MVERVVFKCDDFGYKRYRVRPVGGQWMYTDALSEENAIGLVVVEMGIVAKKYGLPLSRDDQVKMMKNRDLWEAEQC